MKQLFTERLYAKATAHRNTNSAQKNKSRFVFCKWAFIIVLLANAWQSFGQTVSGTNFYAGTGTGSSNTTGVGNNFIGYYSGNKNTSGNYNNFFGSSSGRNNISGYFNNFLGYNSGLNNSTGSSNNFLGNGSGYYNTTGSNNNFIGYTSGYSNTTGSSNNFIGISAGYSNTSGDYNNFIGNNAGRYNTTGYNNTFIGGGSGNSNTTGLNNSYIGNSAGFSNTTGSNNVFLGYYAGYSETGSNKLYISNSNTTTPLIYGDFSTKKLTINDSLASKYFALTNGASNGYILQSDASGNASWVSPSTLSTSSQWTTNGSNIYYSSGKVGIGTSSPSASLHASGTDMNMIRVESSNTAGTWANIKNTSTGGISWSLVSAGSGNGEGAGSFLLHDDNADKVRMMINSSGYVGIGTSSPSQILDVSGTTRTTKFQMTNGATNGYVLQSDASGNATWVSTATLGALRYIGTSYIGSTSGYGGTGTSEGTSSNLYNNFLGYNAGHSNTTGNYNNFLGNNSGYYNTTGKSNNFLGYNAGLSNTTGNYNNFLGDGSGYNNTTGNYNNFLGNGSGFYNTTGSSNNFMGYNAGLSNTTGNYNNFLGNGSGFYNTTGNYNNFLGSGSGFYNTTGNNNNFLGNNTGYKNTTGGNNNYLGIGAGYSNSTGSNNVFLGYNAGYYETGSNKLYISNSNTTAPLIYGDFSTKKLTINDSLASKYFTLTNGAVSGYILQSDAKGNASWVSPSSLSSSSQWTTNGNSIYYSSGNVGIGTSSPSFPLHVSDDDKYMVHIESSNTEGSWLNLKNTSANGREWNIISTGSDNGEGAGNLLFRDFDAGEVRMMISTSGKVGIGTTSPTESLEVKGNIKTDSVKTAGFTLLGDDDSTTIDAAINGTMVLYGQDGKNTDYSKLDSSLTGSYSLWVEDGIISGDLVLAYTSDWADYVFDKDYKLMPLKDVENYINNNHHLPGIPAATEASKSYSVAKINTGFLKKIEELTLYTIDQDKRIEEQTKQISDLTSQLQALQAMVNKLAAQTKSSQ